MVLYTATVSGASLGRQNIAKYHFSDGFPGGIGDQDHITNIIQRMNDVYDLLELGLGTQWSTSSISVVDSEGVVGRDEDFSHVGTLVGDPLPEFVTATVRFLRPTPAVRHGYKRFSGVLEPLTSNGQLTGAIVTQLNLFIAGMLLPVSPVGIVLSFCQVRKFANGQPLPQNNWVIAPFQAGVINGLGTQNTRKD